MAIKDERYRKIKEHYAKAVKKHPEFCPSGRLFPFYTEAQAKERMVARQFMNDRFPRLVNAMSFLQEELLEMEYANAQGDTAKAIDECYDAIAVLLRMAEMMEDKKNED